MRKILTFFIIITGFFINEAHAQKDTIIAYMKYTLSPFVKNGSADIANNKDSADFIRMITSPDSSADPNLFPVSDFYMDGKPMMLGRSSVGEMKIVLQGKSIWFYPNGHKKMICSFKDSERDSDIVTFYPNGKVYYTGNYIKGKLILTDCSDSTGNLIAEKGYGKWIKYSDNFANIIEQGHVENGMQQGEWKGRSNDTINYIYNYTDGEITSGTSFGKSGTKYQFNKARVEPEFPGGFQKFGGFLRKNIRYPRNALMHNTSGRVIVTFIIEKDGSVSNASVICGVGDGLDEEALRVINLSSKWIPAVEHGIPVRVQYSVPIVFIREIKPTPKTHLYVPLLQH